MIEQLLVLSLVIIDHWITFGFHPLKSGGGCADTPPAGQAAVVCSRPTLNNEEHGPRVDPVSSLVTAIANPRLDWSVDCIGGWLGVWYVGWLVGWLVWWLSNLESWDAALGRVNCELIPHFVMVTILQQQLWADQDQEFSGFGGCINRAFSSGVFNREFHNHV